MWRTTSWPATSLILSLLPLLGCGTKSARESAGPSTDLPVVAALTEQRQVSDRFAKDEIGVGAGETVATTPAGLNHRIVYTAEIELAVEDFSVVPDRVIALVRKFDSYVADSNLSGTTGESRRGSWKVRVPVARFEEFVGAAKGLGELIRAGTSSRDVSEEYYDVDARIRNKTKEEDRLLKLLDERPGKLEDVIAIERELSRVREELERMQGRMRVLNDLTSLTTVELSVIEIRDYQPPEAPTLATRVRRSFEGSLSALESGGEELLVAAVATVPWLPVLAVGLCPAYFVVRRARRPHNAERPGRSKA